MIFEALLLAQHAQYKDPIMLVRSALSIFSSSLSDNVWDPPEDLGHSWSFLESFFICACLDAFRCAQVLHLRDSKPCGCSRTLHPRAGGSNSREVDSSWMAFQRPRPAWCCLPGFNQWRQSRESHDCIDIMNHNKTYRNTEIAIPIDMYRRLNVQIFWVSMSATKCHCALAKMEKKRPQKSVSEPVTPVQFHNWNGQIGQKLARCLFCQETEIENFKTATFDEFVALCNID